LWVYYSGTGGGAAAKGNDIMQRMALTTEEVEHIAALARLRLTAAEKAQFREQLSAILDYMTMLRRLDTTAIEPTATVLPLRTVLRPDVVRPSLTPAELLAAAPAAEAQMFRVPPVLD
jgi:aspartyl-tRNA(Asn)/glutamyl-tRNA(Gln) amidotransferase subunit C